jgi:carotenoid cleavage dioxygenase
MNAYDLGPGPDDGVVIDLCVYDRMFDTDVDGPFGDGAPRLERWELHPVTRSATISVIDDRTNEFPRHRGSLSGKPYRYGYTVGADLSPAGWTTLKHDLQTGDRSVFDHGPGRSAGEAVFVPRADSGPDAAEDDGWLLTLVHDIGRESTDFVVLDAQDFDRGYVARVELPQRVPFGFHGNWVSDQAIPPPGSAG